MHVDHILTLIIFALVHLIRNSERIIMFKISKDGVFYYVAITSYVIHSDRVVYVPLTVLVSVVDVEPKVAHFLAHLRLCQL